MDISATDVGRFGIGRFGDLRLQKRGPGAIRHSWLRRARAFLNWQAASGAEKPASGGFCITLP